MSDNVKRGLAGGLTNYGDPAFAAYLRRSFAQSMGYSRELLSKPVVGITWTASDFNNCHRGVPRLVEAAKRGVLASGGLPMDFPVPSLGEIFLNPTSMVFRNLMAMATEEMIRAQPMDAVILIGGCDKTLPALAMGAISAGKPAIMLATGPMMTSRFKGERLGACTDCRRFWARYRAGEIVTDEIENIERTLATTEGTCSVMGTASTMAILCETLGLMLPGTAAIPAVHADRLRAAEESGRAAMRLVETGQTYDGFLTQASFDNALKMLLAVGGSTNAIIHLAAMAGRLGLDCSLERLNSFTDDIPVLVDLKPTGQGYMEDFFAAGGVGAMVNRLRDRLDLDALTVTGVSLGQAVDLDAIWIDENIIRPLDNPVRENGGLVGLSGSLAPGGAVIKRAAADERLFETTARAVVFDGLADLSARIDDPDLDVTENDALVLKNAGPIGAGMPEAGYLPIPAKLARQGVKDMLRISDARMSGTAFGTIVLHVSPEASAGGPLALVENGDLIRISVRERRLDLLVADEELERRVNIQILPPVKVERGWMGLFRQHVLQAEKGCDLDFLVKT
ncbi:MULTISPECIES: dihydroxy-acid dehydratase [unclassified Chelatococcus]|uniref:dihydroxy-acid dehydratase n=1 Tax=unclassified Chelatococcus TaxID=2638111 RepID=UPI001BCAF83F|nr:MULTISPECIES: dihydroxy-acid dehydratase [unclassified Chelatococcus]MBS7701553.1 dihydroxy-acid dehydratase [Chelatococcus sp. YT9]MBX3557388.1 dihydroxy-acid dehydratase [Chelatococcus sp.]